MSNLVILVPLAAAVLCYAAILLAMPFLARYALARPNARSSHKIPTPQGGGIAVIAVTVALSLAVAEAVPSNEPILANVMPLLIAAGLLAIVGAVDDIWTLGVLPRLVLQLVAILVVVLTLPAEARIAPVWPFWLERGLLVVGLLWYVNLVNFMDGIDWMTVAEFIPLTGALILLFQLGALPAVAALPTYALFGALIGFAPFNRPVAKLFLGDVGSLPIGLITGWLLLQLAIAGHITAALLLPLYYLADATLTLLRRAANGEKVWTAHRSHFYQRATRAGMTVPEVVARVAGVNVVLVTLALVSVGANSMLFDFGMLAIGSLLVAWLLANLVRGRK